MKNTALAICSALVVVLAVSCVPNRFKSEFQFGNKLAEQGLWDEAYFRWQKSLSGGNETAALHNNLAVYFERQGKIKSAEAEYKKALKLDPNNEEIQKNYKKFKLQTGGKEKNED